MGWVHGHRRRGAYLALAALLLQIAVSFGHVDVDGIAGPDHLTLAGLHKTVVAKISRHGPAQPSGDDDGYCPICASIFMVSNSFVSEPPQLPVPDGFERIKHSVSVGRDIALPRRVAFRSRGPPAA
ncbi:MAG: hypothetical protein WCA56_06090 [Xanthobacteraceae bacterium]